MQYAQVGSKRRCSYLKGPTWHFWRLTEEFPSGAENIKELEWFYFPWVNSSLFSLLKLTSFHTENTRKSFFQSATKACPSAIFIAFVSLIRTLKCEQNTQSPIHLLLMINLISHDRCLLRLVTRYSGQWNPGFFLFMNMLKRIRWGLQRPKYVLAQVFLFMWNKVNSHYKARSFIWPQLYHPDFDLSMLDLFGIFPNFFMAYTDQVWHGDTKIWVVRSRLFTWTCPAMLVKSFNFHPLYMYTRLITRELYSFTMPEIK